MAPFPLRALGQERAISEPPWDKDALGLNGANSMKGKTMVGCKGIRSSFGRFWALRYQTGINGYKRSFDPNFPDFGAILLELS